MGNAYHLVAWEQMLGPLDAAVRSFEQSFFHEPMCWFVEGKHPAPPRSNQPLGTIRASGPEFSLSKPVRCDLDGPMQCRAARNTLLFFWHGLSSASSSGSPPLTIFKALPLLLESRTSAIPVNQQQRYGSQWFSMSSPRLEPSWLWS
jgi:hypothetical protein